jgi:hypothetical protein
MNESSVEGGAFKYKAKTKKTKKTSWSSALGL